MKRLHSRTSVALLLLLVSAAACQSVFDDSSNVPPTPTPIPTPIIPDNPVYRVQQGEVIRQLEFTGRVSPVDEVNQHFRTNGHVKSVFVERDDIVDEGDLLAELEIDDLLKAMEQAQVSLNSAELRLSEAEAELERQISQAELDLLAAKTRREQAEEDHAAALFDAELAIDIAEAQLAKLRSNQTNLHAEELAARINLSRAADSLSDAQIEYQKALDRTWEPDEVKDAYASALQNAEWNHDLAVARHNQTLAAQQSHLHDITIQELLITQREAELVQLERGIDPLLAIDEERAQQAVSRLQDGVDPVLINEVSQASLALERLQAQVLDGQIVASMSGRVLSVSLRPGREVVAFDSVITLADMHSMEISANLTDNQMEELTEGLNVIVSYGSYPGSEWEGTVRRLPYPYGAGGGTQTLDGTDRSARINIEDGPAELELGDVARVRAVLEVESEALWLPPEAIRAFQGRKFVVIEEDGRQRRVDVQLGIESQNRVEILEGVELDTLVIGQ